jgi:hypothetical protein
VVAASILAIESPVFIWVHVQDREIPANNNERRAGMLLAFIAYAGREMIPSCALRYTVPK